MNLKKVVIGAVAFLAVGVGIYVASRPVSASQLTCSSNVVGGVQCPTGYYCKIDKKAPDSGGICVPLH